MTDPLSVAASVVGIAGAALQSIHFLVTTIDRIQDAPKVLKGITSDLKAIEPVLKDLAAGLQPGDGSPPDNRGSNILLAAKNCQDACEDFGDQLTLWMRHSKKDKMFWLDRWNVAFFGQTTMDIFTGNLRACKETLTIALTSETFTAVRGLQRSVEAFQPVPNAVDTKVRPAHVQGRVVELSREESRLDQQLVSVQYEGVVVQKRVNQVQELLRQLSKQQETNTLLGETIGRAKQNIRNVKARNQGVALTGFINTQDEASKPDQDISDIEADNKGFVIAGMANNINIKDVTPR